MDEPLLAITVATDRLGEECRDLRDGGYEVISFLPAGERTVIWGGFEHWGATSREQTTQITYRRTEAAMKRATETRLERTRKFGAQFHRVEHAPEMRTTKDRTGFNFWLDEQRIYCSLCYLTEDAIAVGWLDSEKEPSDEAEA